MNLNPATFPFKYLGILISPKRLAASTFIPIVDQIRNTCNHWNNFNLSSAAKAILINSTLLSIPIYVLFVYSIPDLILSEITKVVRKFFWSKDSNRKGIHNVNWNTIIEGKPEGALELKIFLLTSTC